MVSNNKIDKSERDLQELIWEIQAELKGYSVLFKGFQHPEFEDNHFFGIGLRLEQMISHLEIIKDDCG